MANNANQPENRPQPYMEDPFSTKSRKSTTTSTPVNTPKAVTTAQRIVVDIPPSPQPEWGKKYAFFFSSLINSKRKILFDSNKLTHLGVLI